MSWSRFKSHYYSNTALGFSLDISRIPFPDGFLAQMEPAMQKAFAAMSDLEKGAVANPDEQRMVGHYWLRDAALAPTAELRHAIEAALQQIHVFSAAIHSGKITAPGGKRFT
ncbi:MAG: glucose-6-phosphate isomerase, partial [Opitutaceae bacterium]|nr:glucose-6-phosphate isomerase [Opitutaceae bacterium]